MGEPILIASSAARMRRAGANESTCAQQAKSSEQSAENREEWAATGAATGCTKAGHNSAMVGGATNPDDMCESECIQDINSAANFPNFATASVLRLRQSLCEVLRWMGLALHWL